MFRDTKKIHFVGIGGIGMSGIAEVLINLGFDVSGSDIRESDIIRHLQKLGAKIFIGHSEENIKDIDVLVYSSAVKVDNPEIVGAIKRGIPVIKRAEMMGEMMRLKFSIAIAGTHGKTTTTSMIAGEMLGNNMDPTVIVGGLLIVLVVMRNLEVGNILYAKLTRVTNRSLNCFPQ